MKLNPATVPNLFEKAPKPISPRVHAWLDVAVTSYFAAAGAFFWARGNKRAASAAFLNAGMVAGVSLMTDYYGTGEKPISFKMHGTLDVVQAATAATAPPAGSRSGARAATPGTLRSSPAARRAAP